MFKFILKVKNTVTKYPVMRGMITYSLLWPSSNFLQQSMDQSRSKIDLMEMFRYFLLGTFATAPTVYSWVKFAGYLIKGNHLKHSLTKAALDVIIFAPIGQTQFYIGINLLEGKKWEECVEEWKEKLIPTWKVAVCFWPAVQTLNFMYVPERNRVVIVSLASFVWTIFLSFMHDTSGVVPSN